MIFRAFQNILIQGFAGNVHIELIISTERTLSKILPSSHVVMLRHKQVPIPYRGSQANLRKYDPLW